MGVDSDDGALDVLLAVEGSMSCRDLVGVIQRAPVVPEAAFGKCPVGHACMDNKVY